MRYGPIVGVGIRAETGLVFVQVGFGRGRTPPTNVAHVGAQAIPAAGTLTRARIAGRR